MTAKLILFHIMQTQREVEERIEACEIEAGWFFDQATKAQKSEFDATMHSLLGVTGPKWNRAREAARAQWRDSTKEARELYERTVEWLLDHGEISEALDSEWTALIDREAVRAAMEAAE